MRMIFLYSLIFLPFIGFSQQPTTTGKSLQDSIVLSNTPLWVHAVLENSEIARKYKIIQKFNPFYFESDFNGDDLIDIAFFVENTIDQRQGLMIINSGKNNVYIVGCGNPTEMGMSLSWSKSWFVYREKTVRNATKKSVTLTAPGIFIKSSSDSNLLVYWSGSKYKTFAQIY